MSEADSLICFPVSRSEQLQASAYNALGISYRAEGGPQDAALAFLRVELLFPHQSAARAEALYQLSELWTELGHADRAAEARQTLRDNFAGSAWARKLADRPSGEILVTPPSARAGT